MLDPSQPQYIDLVNFSCYLKSCIQIAENRLSIFRCLKDIEDAEVDLNSYPRLDKLFPPRGIIIIDEKNISNSDLLYAVQAILDGRVLFEHTCAGEATRLGLGAKYLINPVYNEIINLYRKMKFIGGDFYSIPIYKLKPIGFGRRHMLQLAWDLWQLALEVGYDPVHILSRQTLLVIVNANNVSNILSDFVEANFYGFSRKRVLFMIQRTLPGLFLANNKWIIDYNSLYHLHNHGQIFMQSTMNNQFFYLDDYGKCHFLSRSDFFFCYLVV